METKQYNERILEDDYPMHYNYLYVVGGKVFKNKIGLTSVGECRRELAKHAIVPFDVQIMSCDIIGRNLQHLME